MPGRLVEGLDDVCPATWEAARQVDHAADLKDRGLPDGGQSVLAVAHALVAVAVEVAEVRHRLERGTLSVEAIRT